MANPNAQTHDIDLASPDLNLDKYKSGIYPFAGFNDRNSPYISHEIKNLYVKKNDFFIGAGEFIVNGDDIKLKNKTLYVNDVAVHTCETAVRYYNLTNFRKSYELTGVQFACPKLINDYLYYLTYGGSQDNEVIVWRTNPKTIEQDKIYTEDELSVFTKIATYEFSGGSIKTIDFVLNGTTPIVAAIIDNGARSNFCVRVGINNYAELTVYENAKSDIIIHANGPSSSYFTFFMLTYPLDADFDELPYVNGVINYRSGGVFDIYDKSKYEAGYIGSEPLLKCYLPFNYGFVINPNYVKEKSHWEQLPKRNNGSTIIIFSSNVTNTTPGVPLVTPSALSYTDIDANSLKFPLVANLPDLKIRIKYDRYCPCIPFAYQGDDDNFVLFYAAYGQQNCLAQCVVGADTGIDGFRVGTTTYETSTTKKTDIRLLYTDGVLTGLSAYRLEATLTNLFHYAGNLLFEENIIKNLLEVDYDRAVFETNKNNLYLITISESNVFADLQIYDKRYVIFQTADFLNCYDLEKRKLTHISDDWNNCFMSYGYNAINQSIQTDCIAASVGAFFQADYVDSGIKHAFPGRQGNSRFVRYLQDQLYAPKISILEYQIPDSAFSYNSYIYGLDVFYKTGGESNTPGYSYTLPKSHFGAIYPPNLVYTNTDGNLQEPIPIKVTYDNSNLIPIVKMLETETLIFPIGTEYFALYYLLMVQENIEHIFTIQSSLYATSANRIFSITYNNGIVTVNKEMCKVDDLLFLCSTPVAAFFWSKFNHTLYQFQGDAVLHRGQTIDEIEKIYYVDYIESTNDIVMCCDKYIVVLSEQYAYKLQYDDPNAVDGLTDSVDVFFDYDNDIYYYIIQTKGRDKYIALKQFSYNKKAGFAKEPIILKTKLYGLGDNVLSETDCVFIRVFNAENETEKQMVKVGGFTLTDKKTPLVTRTYEIQASDWGEDGTYYIRYQPTFQKALGIQIEIESTVPIVYVGISNIPDAKMISKI